MMKMTMMMMLVILSWLFTVSSIHSSQYGYNALYLACYNEHWDVAEYLLVNGADPDIKDKVSMLFNDKYNAT